MDLSGSIFVLTHPRTGSSLVMQTLRCLGVDVIGDFSREDLPQAGNPKGYYEDRALFREGLHARTFVHEPSLLRGRAVKVALNLLARRQSAAEWTALSRPDVRLLLPIRDPMESLLSHEALLRQTPGAPGEEAVFHWAARAQLTNFGFLAARVGESGFAGAVPACIDYRLAIEDPLAYVDCVAHAARLSPTASQVAAAIANIDAALYRFRRDDVGNAGRAADRVRPLIGAHELLRRDDPFKWMTLRGLLPPWVLAQTGTLAPI